MWISALSNRYIQLLLVFLLAVSLGYYKGYSVKSDEVEVKRLKEFEVVTAKLDKVYNFSVSKSDDARKYLVITNTKLKTIIDQLGSKPLTDTPCVPSQEFSIEWNKLNEALSSNTAN